MRAFDNSRYSNSFVLGICMLPSYILALILIEGAPWYQKIILYLITLIITGLIYSIVVIHSTILSRGIRYALLFAAQASLLAAIFKYSS